MDLISSNDAQQIQKIKVMVIEVAEGHIYTLQWIEEIKYKERMNNFKWFSFPISKYRVLVLTSSFRVNYMYHCAYKKSATKTSIQQEYFHLAVV